MNKSHICMYVHIYQGVVRLILIFHFVNCKTSVIIIHFYNKQYIPIKNALKNELRKNAHKYVVSECLSSPIRQTHWNLLGRLASLPVYRCRKGKNKGQSVLFRGVHRGKDLTNISYKTFHSASPRVDCRSWGWRGEIKWWIA